MKHLTFLLLAGILTFNCDISDHINNVDNNFYSAESEFTYNISSGGKNRLVISGITGTVDIIGNANADTVFIYGVKRIESESSADAQHSLQYLDINISESNQTLYIETQQPQNTNGRNYIVNFTINLPLNWAVTVNQINGNVTINSLNSKSDINITNGNITLYKLDADIYAHTTNGQIEAEITIPANSLQNFKTTNGAIFLSIPRETSTNLFASVTNGLVNTNNLPIDNTGQTNKTVDVQLGNGGSSTTTLRTTNGNITVNGI